MDRYSAESAMMTVNGRSIEPTNAELLPPYRPGDTGYVKVRRNGGLWKVRFSVTAVEDISEELRGEGNERKD